MIFSGAFPLWVVAELNDWIKEGRPLLPAMHAADPRLQHFITACRTGQAQHPPIVSIRWCNLRDGHQHHGSDIGQRGHGRFINVATLAMISKV
jgi:hypothetical protein